MPKMWKWIPKSEKPKSPIEKVDVWKEDETVIKSDAENEKFSSNNKATSNSTSTTTQLKNHENVVVELSIQSKLLIAKDDRECFETILGEKYVDTGTYF